MQSDAWIQILLRTLPAIVVLILGFFAATDKSSRERWTDVLYQLGSIRPDQRGDTKIGSGVKWPFFAVALFLLIWPVQYYRLATRKFEVKSDIYSTRKAPSIYDKAADNAATNSVSTEADAATENTASGPPVHEDPPAPGTTSSPSGSGAAGSGRNIYGQPR